MMAPFLSRTESTQHTSRTGTGSTASTTWGMRVMASTPSVMPCPPASEPWAMRTSTPSSATRRACPTVWTWWMTFAPAAWARSTSSPGSPKAKETTAGSASRVTRKASSSSRGTTWLTAKGRPVSSRTRLICPSTVSADSKTAPMLPKPPASETAATSSGAVAGQIAACMMGTSTPRRSHTGVRNIPSSSESPPPAPLILPCAELYRCTTHSGRLHLRICRNLYRCRYSPNFYEKALFVKPTWR